MIWYKHKYCRWRRLAEKTKKGEKGKKSVALAIGCVIERARKKLEKHLNAVSFADPKIPLVSNATCKICVSGEELKVKRLLAD